MARKPPLPGARIVIEAKEDASYNLKKALEEMEEARKNRGAGTGLFCLSKRAAPSGLEVFNRYGNDVVVIWDAEDTGSDVFLDAGLSVARALCARPKSISEEADEDFEALERAFWKSNGRPKGWMKSPSPQRLFVAAAKKIQTVPVS